MRENITKVAKRGEALDSLQDKTGQHHSHFPLTHPALKCVVNMLLSLTLDVFR
jgi:hypothetical protein